MAWEFKIKNPPNDRDIIKVARKLCAEIKNTTKWEEFGMNLLLTDSNEAMKLIDPDDKKSLAVKCKDLLDFWKSNNDHLQWEEVIEASRNTTGLRNFATALEESLEATNTKDHGETKVGEKRKTASQNETEAKKPKEDNASVDKEPSFSLESLKEKYQKAISVGYTQLRYDELSAQQKEILNEVQAMLVVVNKSEFMAAMSYLKPLVNHNYQSILEIHNVITLGHDKNSLVFFIGMFGKCPVAVTRVNQGCGRDALHHSGCFNNILLIAAVGVAAGFPENDVNLGDVIVSQQITDCSIYKEKNGERIPRGNTTPAFKYLVDRLKKSELQWEFECASQGTKSSVTFGLFLSKPVLLDDKEEREKMLKYFGKEAKGYEMEGFSIAGGAIDCIIVKGVCDFASGKNKIWQPTAALAAIDCLHHDLMQMDLSLMKDVIQKDNDPAQNQTGSQQSTQGDGTFDCAVAAQTLKQRVQLTNIPYNSMKTLLYSKDVITRGEKQKLDKMTNDEQMSELIHNILIVSLENKVTKKYKGFLESMEQSEDILLKEMAKSLGGSKSVPDK